MRNHSHSIGRYWLILLLAFSASVFSTSLSAGAWQLDTDLNASAAQSMFSALTFSPQTNLSANAWQVSSPGMLFSDGTGAIGASVVLDPSCPVASAPACAQASDLYKQQDSRLVHLGRLSFHSNSMFSMPSTAATSGGLDYPTSSQDNASLPATPDAPFSIPQDWMWALAAVLVLGLTAAFMLRNKD